MRLKLSIPLLLFVFFIFLGYLEGGLNGLIAGFICPALAYILLPLSLIPFGIGFCFWFLSFQFLAGNLTSYLALPDLMFKTTVVFGSLALLINICTSIGLVTILLLLKRLNVLETKALEFSPLKELLSSQQFKDIFDKVLEYLISIWDAIDKKLLGSLLFWFGLGLEAHDFYWETQEAEVDAKRPTHGFWQGLELTITGMDLITTGNDLKTKVKLLLPFYSGVALSALGFILTSLIPKGFSRIITHFLYWPGLGLQVYNWYILMQDYLYLKQQALKRKRGKPTQT